MTTDQFPKPPTPQTWGQFFSSADFVHKASMVIMLAITVATTQLTNCKTTSIKETQGVAAKAAADTNVNTAVLRANLEGNTPAAEAKVAEAVKTAEQVKSATQEAK